MLRPFKSDPELHEMIDDEYDVLAEDRNTVRTIFPRGDSKCVLPCNMDRIIWNAQKVFNLNKRTKSDILPSEIIESVKELRPVFKNDMPVRQLVLCCLHFTANFVSATHNYRPF